jgi:hypothetical protein
MFDPSDAANGTNPRYGMPFAMQPNPRTFAIMARAALRAQRAVLAGMLEVVDATLKEVEEAAAPPAHENIKVR